MRGRITRVWLRIKGRAKGAECGECNVVGFRQRDTGVEVP
jgi:hypothetical protein